MKGRTMLALLLIAAPAAAQERPARWEREAPTVAPVTVFHSPQSANLPTAETIRRNELQIEISHRFEPALSAGADALWGLDGPVNNRLGLAWGVTDRTMLTFQRSSLEDNLDLNVKVRLAEGRAGSMAWMAGAVAGVAWSTEVPGREGSDDRNRQYYAQGIVNALLGGRWAVGLVPWWLHNPRIRDAEAEDAAGLGLAAQLYATPGFSVFGEWNFSGARDDLEHGAGSFGIELETGGHFFKVHVTNSTRLNPAQYLAGTPHPFTLDDLRLGFNITRLVAF